MLGRMTPLLAYTVGQWIAFLILVVPWILLVVYEPMYGKITIATSQAIFPPTCSGARTR